MRHKRADLETAIVRKMLKGGETEESARVKAAKLIDLQIQAKQCSQEGDDIVLTPAGTQQVQDHRKSAQAGNN